MHRHLSLSHTAVSTLVVEWIEMHGQSLSAQILPVSTLVVEWIEISFLPAAFYAGVSPPSWWSGLKSRREENAEIVLRLHPRGGVD